MSYVISTKRINAIAIQIKYLLIPGAQQFVSILKSNIVEVELDTLNKAIAQLGKGQSILDFGLTPTTLRHYPSGTPSENDKLRASQGTAVHRNLSDHKGTLLNDSKF